MDKEFDNYQEEYLIQLMLNLSLAKDDLCEEEDQYLIELQDYLKSNYDGISPREPGKSYKKTKVIKGSKLDE